MDGGVSQMDSFDPKPLLRTLDGKPFAAPMEPTQFNNNGNTFGSPWEFKQYGESGLPVSGMFPFVGECADELCVVRSMTSKFSEHHSANYFLHTGAGIQGRPSMGAWAAYGLGSENQDLPGFVVLDAGLIPSGGAENFGWGFLPAAYQASVFRRMTRRWRTSRRWERRAGRAARAAKPDARPGPDGNGGLRAGPPGGGGDREL